MLHEEDVEYFERVKAVGFHIADLFGIDVKVIEPKRRPNGAYGLAYCSEQRICVLVRDKAFQYDGGKWATERHSDKEVAHTLGHELAHLLEYQRHGKTNHGERFKVLEAAIVEEVNKVF